MAASVGIIGAAGFAGSELTGLIMQHPEFELRAITSDSLAGTLLSEVNPGYVGSSDIRFTHHDNEALLECDAVFLAVPHTAALELAPPLIEAGVSVFDLSADYRLKDPAVYEAWYKTPHSSPDLLAKTVFGLPELNRTELESANVCHSEGEAVLVACAGCYPTASSIAAYPAINAELVTTPVIIDAISGITGAGKSATERTHFCFASENLEAYALTNHRHTPEIEQILGLPGQVIFSPHLAPLNRGILATVYLPLREASLGSKNLADLVALYRDFYRNDSFVEVLEGGRLPKTSSVAGTNKVQLGLAFAQQTKTLIVVSAIDNLCKGAAGQAVQCANIVFGLPEESGLEAIARYV